MVHRFEQCTGIGHKRLLFFGLTLSALRQTGQDLGKKVFNRKQREGHAGSGATVRTEATHKGQPGSSSRLPCLAHTLLADVTPCSASHAGVLTCHEFLWYDGCRGVHPLGNTVVALASAERALTWQLESNARASRATTLVKDAWSPAWSCRKRTCHGSLTSGCAGHARSLS